MDDASIGGKRKGKHVARYLASFAYRFNRRFYLPDLFARLGLGCSQNSAHVLQALKVG